MQSSIMNSSIQNIILIGFMGCGKTSIGIRLSYKLRRTMTDTDKRIERQQRMTVSEIFSRLGEEEFRRMETGCLEQLLEEKGTQIISVGGGLPVREENRRLLKQLGVVVYLRVTPETVCKRLEGDTTRPLLQGEDPEEKIRRLMTQRSAFYEEAADVILDTDGKEPEDIVEEIVEAVMVKNHDR